MLNSCVNPLIYSNLHTSFRRSSLRLLCSCVFERFKSYHWDNMSGSIRTIARRSSRSVRGSIQSSRGLLSMRRKSTESVTTIAMPDISVSPAITMGNNNNGSLSRNNNSKNGSNRNNSSSNNGSLGSYGYSNNESSTGLLASSMSSSRKSMRCQLLSKRSESIDNNNEERIRHSTKTSFLSPSPNTTEFFNGATNHSSNSSEAMKQGFEIVANNNNNKDIDNYSRNKLSSLSNASSMSQTSNFLNADNSDLIVNNDVFVENENDKNEAIPLTIVKVADTPFTPDPKLTRLQSSVGGDRHRHKKNKAEHRRLTLQSMREQSTIEEML